MNDAHRKKHLATPVSELPPLPLHVPRDAAAEAGMHEGDIVTLGNCRELHTGFVVDPELRFRVVLVDKVEE